MLRRKKRWDSKENLPNVKFFLGDNIQNRQSTKIIEMENNNGIFEKQDALQGFFGEKFLQSAKVVVLLESQYMF